MGCDSVNGPVTTPSITADRLMQHVRTLAHDSMLGRRAGSPQERLAAAYVRDALREFGLDAGVDGYFQDFSLPGEPLVHSQNVIGVLPGQGPLAQQWIVVGAHYDHLGAVQVSADSMVVFNGADDNASGTSVMLELARYLSHYFTRGEGSGVDRRSMIFQAFGAEEQGLVGSNYFCNAPTVPISDIAAMVNLDMVGRMQADNLTVIGTGSSDQWPGMLQAANDDSLTLIPNDKYLGGSDQYCFYMAGTPVEFFFTGLHEQYHTPDDDPPLLNPQGMVAVAHVALNLLRDLVTRAERP